MSLAELIPTFEQVHVRSGEILFRTGEEGDAFFIIIEGIVRVFIQPGGKDLEVACLGPGEWFGEMALLTGEPRSTDIEAETDLVLLRLSRKNFDQLIRKHPSLGVSLAGLLAAKLISTNAVMRGVREGAQTPPSAGSAVYRSIAAPPAGQRRRLSPGAFRWLRQRRFLGLLLGLALAACASFALSGTGIGTGRIVLLDLLLVATVLWSLQAFSFLGLHRPSDPCGRVGRGDPRFCLFRFFQLHMVPCPRGFRDVCSDIEDRSPLQAHPSHDEAFPPQLRRPDLCRRPFRASPDACDPFAQRQARACESPRADLERDPGFKKGSDGAVGLSMATLLGYGNMSIAFMNGSFICFFMIGFLPPAIGATITWAYWLKATWLLSASFFCLTYLAIITFYRPAEVGELDSSVTDVQLRALGPLTMEEKVCLLAVAISLGGFLTQSWHHIDGAWITLLSLLVLLATSVLDEQTLRNRIDWGFLISLGALVGFGNVIAGSGLPEIVSREARPYLQFLVGSRLVFLLSATMGIVLLRLIMPAFPAIVVSVLALLPMGASIGINPFVIGVVVLLVIEPWLLPHQSMIFQTLWSATEGRLFDHRQILKPALVHVLVCLAAVALSIPYWKYVGLIR